MKTNNRLFLANPTDEYACHLSSLALPRSYTGSRIGQLDLLGIVDYVVFVTWSCNVCAKLFRREKKICHVS